jgi:hypothetical protein
MQEDFGLSRYERRGATTRAQAVKVPHDVLDWVNRWNIGEEDEVQGPMRVIYLERKQMMEMFLHFSLPSKRLVVWRLRSPSTQFVVMKAWGRS